MSLETSRVLETIMIMYLQAAKAEAMIEVEVAEALVAAAQ